MKKHLALSLHLLISTFLFAQTLPAYLPADGLVAWYPFNGNANDESGNGNHGTVNGASLTEDRNGNLNTAYSFNGSNNYITVPFSSSFNSIQTGLTMSAWVLMSGGTGASTPPRVMELRGAYGNGGDAGFVMLAQDNSSISRTFEVRWHNNFGNTNISIAPTSNVSSLVWHYLVFTADGNSGVGKFYVDGQLINDNSSMQFQGLINSCNYNNNPLILGAETNLLGKWGGKLDDIAIYNRALTQEEITALYTATPVNGGGGNTSANAAPPGIPYQAVVRNANGQVAANTAITTRFTLHQNTADGAVEYQETHALTTNAQGLMSTVLGQGDAVQNAFASINWANTTKFLQVEVDLGNGFVDLGTQQLMSVPFALYAANGPQGPAGPQGPQGIQGEQGPQGPAGQNAMLSVSTTGDTLYTGTGFIIVPGISAANYPNTPSSNTGLGSTLLPGNTTCQNETISVTGCGGQTFLTYDGRTYDLVEIGGQCWFADNLATDQYRNGDPIPTGLDNTTWSTTTSGAYAIYNDDPANDAVYGKLYNWYTTVDTRGLCPSGWHVPSDCDWMYLEGSLGMSAQEQVLTNAWRGTDQGVKLKSIYGWMSNNNEFNNSSGFTAIPGGYREFNGIYYYIESIGRWWTNNQDNFVDSWLRMLDSPDRVYRDSYSKNCGFSIRCLKD